MNPDRTSLEWLTKLISFDSTSHRSNLDLIAEIHDFFDAQNIKTRLTHDPAGKKANLFATLPAHDNAITGGLVLSGHTDVVPVNGQSWETDPFCATLIGERVYGRGTSDMKAFIAVTLALVPEFKQMKLAKPLHFAFSYDEEVGGHGALVLIADLQKEGIHPDGCIVGEPTELRPMVAHKGIYLFHCRLQGQAAHSSLTHQGCNAIEYSAQLICWIRQLADRLKQQGPFDRHYDVPFTTLSVNRIQGGNANNIIPAFCEFFFEVRNLPTMDPQQLLQPLHDYIAEDLLPKMRREYPQASIKIEPIATVPAFEASEQAPLTQLLRQLRQEKQIFKVAYATEAGLFQQAGIPTILCGPGSIEQAHRANEFIAISEIHRCENVLRDLAKSMID